MRVIYPGHKFALRNVDDDDEQILQFLQRAPFHDPIPGVTNQEVHRVLLSRIEVLNAEDPWWGNERMIHNLRENIGMHELRAMLRHAKKGDLRPEDIQVGKDGHFVFVFDWAKQGFPELRSD